MGKPSLAAIVWHNLLHPPESQARQRRLIVFLRLRLGIQAGFVERKVALDIIYR